MSVEANSGKKTPWLPALIAGAIIIYVASLFIFGNPTGSKTGPGDSASSPTEATQAPPTPRTAAKPLATLAQVEGCGPVADEDRDTLLESLKEEERGEAELSAAWVGDFDGVKTTAVALMVRTEQGTINHPQLVWVNDGDIWAAATPETAEVSDLEDKGNLVTQPPVASAINCMIAGSR